MATGTKIDSLYASFGADFKELLAEMRKAEQATAKFRGSVQKELSNASRVLDKFSSVARSAVLGFASAFSVAKIGQVVRSTLEWADNTGTLAERLNITTDQVQELIFAGRELNVTAQQMAAGLVSFWAKVSEAATGKGEGLLVLKQLGLDPASFKNADDALTQIAAKIKQFDRASQLTVAKTFFGDEKAAQFLGLMLGDLEAFKRKAHEVGYVIDSQLIQKGTEINKEFERVADVGMASVRRQTLEIAIGFNEILRNASLLSPVLQDWANRLSRSFVIAQGFMALFDAQEAIRKRMAEQPGTVGRLAQAAAPKLQEAAMSGRRRLNLDSGAASAMEGFEKQIDRMKIQADALKHELNFGRAAAENAKALAEFGSAAGKFKPDPDQVKRFGRALKDVEAQKTALAFKDLATENERLVQIVQAEVSGNRELVAVLEERFRLEDKLGRPLTEAEKQRVETLARAKFAMEQYRDRVRAATQELEGLFDSFADHAGAALDSILDKSKTVGEAMRNFFASVLRDIANEFIKLGAINPLKNLLFGNDPSRPTLDTIGGIIGSIFGGAASGNTALEIGKRAGGGPVTAGMPYIVGEHGRELMIPKVDGTIIPNHALSGGTVTLYGSDAHMIEIGQLKAGLRSLGLQVRQIDRSVEPRAINATVDARRRGGYAAAF